MLWVVWMELSAGSETKQGSLTESVGAGSHIIFGEYPMVGGSDSAVPSALPCQLQQLLPHQSLPHCWLFASWAAELSDCRNAGIDCDTAPPIDRTGETETPPQALPSFSLQGKLAHHPGFMGPVPCLG